MSVRILLALAGAAFVGLIVWAIVAGNGWSEVAQIADLPWGLVTLADLYLGFACFGVLLVARSGLGWRAAWWIVPLLVLGNVVAVVFLLVFWKRLFPAGDLAAGRDGKK